MNFKYETNRIYLENEEGKTVAEINFPNISNTEVSVNRTFVDSSLRGQGMADELMKALTTYLKTNNKKAKATCSYAIGWFEKNPGYSDVYINN